MAGSDANVKLLPSSSSRKTMRTNDAFCFRFICVYLLLMLLQKKFNKTISAFFDCFPISECFGGAFRVLFRPHRRQHRQWTRCFESIFGWNRRRPLIGFGARELFWILAASRRPRACGRHAKHVRRGERPYKIIYRQFAYIRRLPVRSTRDFVIISRASANIISHMIHEQWTCWMFVCSRSFGSYIA